jgi:excisionase family DNA binding protein
MNVPDDLMTATEAGRLLGIHPRVIHRWRIAGRLPGWRLGKYVRYSRADLLALYTREGATPRIVPTQRDQLACGPPGRGCVHEGCESGGAGPSSCLAIRNERRRAGQIERQKPS